LLQLSSDDDDVDTDEEDEDFFKMIYAGAMLRQTYVDMFVKKILQGRLQQVEWGI
jgi:hypothetical protein